MSCNIKVGSFENSLKIQIEGNATWENAKYFLEFIKKYVNEGKKSVLIDVAECAYMDSTYFGVLVELAEYVESKPDGEFYIGNASSKLLEDIKTIGLDKIVCLADSDTCIKYKDIETVAGQFAETYSKIQKAKQILKAHQILEKLSEHNKEEFGNVVENFKNYLEKQQNDE
ncbi:MAG: STAS domain-containing protein [Candidatus Aureabacteria bacterium]|nr:STAS domain-containing protein [Candidatus Auribacterota bacterium]